MHINDTFQYLNTGLPEDIARRKLHGDLAGAIRLIDRRLSQELLPEEIFELFKRKFESLTDAFLPDGAAGDDIAYAG